MAKETRGDELMLDVPFCKNDGDGNRCYQCAMESALEYFLGRKFDLNYLDALTGRRTGYWTSTTQIVPALYNLDLDIKYYSKTDLEPFLDGKRYLKSYYGKDAEVIIKHTDIDQLVKSVKITIESGLFEKKILTLSEIEGLLRTGALPLVLLDWSKITEAGGPYHGHFVALIGFDAENVYVHDSGPNPIRPKMKIDKSKFMAAWNANGTDNDIVIVYGKQEGNHGGILRNSSNVKAPQAPSG